MKNIYIHSQKALKDRRRELRNNPTQQEYLLWQCLRSKKLGAKFQRQHSIGPYIVDFYCASRKLIIEIDGDQHLNSDNIIYDEERTLFLEKYGHEIVRFSNAEIENNVNGVLDTLKAILAISPLASRGG